ncbi:MAG: transglutaminase family protein [Verrucomicrobia bacterium]|jgi:transglutaminase-like putative cysteine protease|nr:transglutaminase family protein [Verrucomicrobiota bacterium]
MKLEVCHRTRYTYAAPVSESFNELRLRPVSYEQQQCENFLLKVLPTARLRHFTDFYANTVHFFELAEPHTSLTVEARSQVITSAQTLPEDATPFSLARVAECARMERCFVYLQDSTYVEKSPEAWRLALDITQGASDLWQAALAIQRHIHREFTYCQASTHAHTHMRQVLQARRGVCQDFAHVMIGLCRSLGIPALYVSGYLYNGPRETLRGAQASHAWCEVFVPGVGWRGLDPTNNRQADEHHVKVAVGRDYADVPPIRGQYRGTLDRQLEVDVLVTRLDA